MTDVLDQVQLTPAMRQRLAAIAPRMLERLATRPEIEDRRWCRTVSGLQGSLRKGLLKRGLIAEQPEAEEAPWRGSVDVLTDLGAAMVARLYDDERQPGAFDQALIDYREARLAHDAKLEEFMAQVEARVATLGTLAADVETADNSLRGGREPLAEHLEKQRDARYLHPDGTKLTLTLEALEGLVTAAFGAGHALGVDVEAAKVHPEVEAAVEIVATYANRALLRHPGYEPEFSPS